MSSYSKYLKYKNKYLDLKVGIKNQIGGANFKYTPNRNFIEIRMLPQWVTTKVLLDIIIPLNLPNFSNIGKQFVAYRINFTTANDALNSLQRVIEAINTAFPIPDQIIPPEGGPTSLIADKCVVYLEPILKRMGVLHKSGRPNAAKPFTVSMYDDFVANGIPNPADLSTAVPITAVLLNICLQNFEVPIPAGRERGAPRNYGPTVVAPIDAAKCGRYLKSILKSIGVLNRIGFPNDAIPLTVEMYDYFVLHGIPNPDDLSTAVPITARTLNMCLTAYGVAIPAGRATPPMTSAVPACAPIVFQELLAQGIVDATGAYVPGTVLTWPVYQNIITVAVDFTVPARATRPLATIAVDACIAAIGGLAPPVDPLGGLDASCRAGLITGLKAFGILNVANLGIVGQTLTTATFDLIVRNNGLVRADAVTCLASLRSTTGGVITLDIPIV